MSAGVNYTVSLSNYTKVILDQLTSDATAAALATENLKAAISSTNNAMAATQGPVDAVSNSLAEHAKIKEKLGKNATEDKSAEEMKKSQGIIEKLNEKLAWLEHRKEQAFDIKHIETYNRAIRKTHEELEHLDKMPPESLFERMGLLGEVAKKLTVTVAGIFAVDKAAEYLHELRNVAIEHERTELLLKGHLGSEKASGEAIKFITEKSRDLKVSTESSLDGFTKMAGVMKGMASQSQMQVIFENWMKVAGASHLTNQELQEANHGMDMMFAKGGTSGKQLIMMMERMPLLAKAAREETGALNQMQLTMMINSGRFDSQKFLPAIFARAAREGQGALTDYLQSAQANTIAQENASHELAVTLGAVLLPAFTAVTQGITWFITGLSNTIEWLKEHKAVGWAVAAVLITLSSLIAFNTIALAYNTVATFMATGAKKAFAAGEWLVTAAIAAYNIIVAIATGETVAFAIALNSTGIPIIIMAIAGLIIGITALWNNFVGFRAVVMGLGQTLIDYIIGPLQTIAGLAVGLASGNWDMFNGGTTRLGNVVSGRSFTNGFFDEYNKPEKKDKEGEGAPSFGNNPLSLLPAMPQTTMSAANNAGNTGGNTELHFHGQIMPNMTFQSINGDIPKDELKETVKNSLFEVLKDHTLMAQGSR